MYHRDPQRGGFIALACVAFTSLLYSYVVCRVVAFVMGEVTF